MPILMLIFITAFSISYLVLPLVIQVARARDLYDEPNDRSAHLSPTPTLGGVGIFSGTFFALILWMKASDFGAMQHVLVAFMFIFLAGARDDLIPLSPLAKLATQVLAAFVLVSKGQIGLHSLYGICGVYALPAPVGLVLSVAVIVLIINAFNLIDGVNGLAASIGLLACVLFGIWFCLARQILPATIAFSIAGSLSAFLKYNVTPARIFMGDTGSQFIGMVCAVLALQFIRRQEALPVGAPLAFHAAPVIALSLLIAPLFDTCWAFVRRIVRGRSPFSPDKNHLHHLLLAQGCSHSQTTAILVFASLCFVGLALALDWLGSPRLLAVQLFLAGLCALCLHWRIGKNNRRA
jgi:UDP-N-acetylmuramyl pentapeptide phosphotransferase/UDP-N-acetylglucosamine-1-phosphate transferase